MSSSVQKFIDAVVAANGNYTSLRSVFPGRGKEPTGVRKKVKEFIGKSFTHDPKKDKAISGYITEEKALKKLVGKETDETIKEELERRLNLCQEKITELHNLRNSVEFHSQKGVYYYAIH